MRAPAVPQKEAVMAWHNVLLLSEEGGRKMEGEACVQLFRELPRGLVSVLLDLGSLQGAGKLRMPGGYREQGEEGILLLQDQRTCSTIDTRQYKRLQLTNFSNWEITHTQAQRNHITLHHTLQKCQRSPKYLPGLIGEGLPLYEASL